MDLSRNRLETEMQTDPKYQEILKLHQMLLDANILHDLRKAFDGWQIRCPDPKNAICSVIEHFGSLGGEEDQLEMLWFKQLDVPSDNSHEDILGYATARDVFDMILEVNNAKF